jgi:hypothetical protein
MGTVGWGWRRALAPALVAAALSACATEADTDGAGDDVVTGAVDFEATGQYLAAASQRSAGEPYRFETSMAMEIAGDGDELSLDAPIMAGEQDGASYEYHMDMEEWVSQVPGSAGALGGDLSIDMASDGTALYIRAPMYASLAEQAGPAGIGPIGELAELGDSWGRVDLGALGDLSLADVQSTTGGSANGSDPRAMLDAVASAEDVERLGTDEIDGTPVNGLGADLSLRDLLEAQGVDAERFVDQMAATVGGLNQADPAVSDEVFQTVFEAQVAFEVWVDGDGYVRRVSYEMDNLEIFSGMEGLASGRLDQLDRFVTSETLDFTDYGAADISIDLPSDAVDVTDAYRRMLEAGQGGG